MFTDKQKETFWKHVKRQAPGECWPWTGTKDRYGYGNVKIENKNMIASRVAYRMVRGEAFDEKLHVLHSCDNRACCNPAHLHAGTHQQNMHEMAERKRARGGRHAS